MGRAWLRDWGEGSSEQWVGVGPVSQGCGTPLIWSGSQVSFQGVWFVIHRACWAQGHRKRQSCPGEQPAPLSAPAPSLQGSLKLCPTPVQSHSWQQVQLYLILRPLLPSAAWVGTATYHPAADGFCHGPESQNVTWKLHFHRALEGTKCP